MMENPQPSTFNDSLVGRDYSVEKGGGPRVRGIRGQGDILSQGVSTTFVPDCRYLSPFSSFFLTILFLVLQCILDLLQLGGSPSYSNGNPFAMDINNSTDPFAEHVFDSFSSKKEFLENGKEINQNTIKVSFTLSSYLPSIN